MRKTFFCVDGHTCGNPVRLVTSGGPLLEGKNMMEKRLHFLKEYDWIRKGLMFEPRGHDMMSGSILYPPINPENDIGVLFIETSGCLPMCGHGTIGTVTMAIQERFIIPKVTGKLRLETPAGLVEVEYKEHNGKVESVKLKNVPSFVYKQNLEVECPDLGKIVVDVAYGGNFYAIIDPQKNFRGIQNYTAGDLIRWSPVVRKRLNELYKFQHPVHTEIKGLSHILWTGDTLSAEADGRNAVFYGDKAIDRSPCGTGTSARMAQLAYKGELEPGDLYIHESFIGSKFTGRVEERLSYGGFPAIVPSIEGWAKTTGYNQIIIDDEDDPYAHGFQVI
ncbi:MAG: 4-hydroxyproline epimerase [Bacteroidota bacterium]